MTPPADSLESSSSNEKILVISDTHFGEEDALLSVDGHSDREAEIRIAGLIEWLASQGPFREIVLLGDIWEMWSSSFEDAHRASTRFLEELASLDFGQMIFLPGNHDHHLLVQHQLVEQIMALRSDYDIDVPAYSQRVFLDSHLTRLFPRDVATRFIVSYPDHFATLNGKSIVFHHGHHIGILMEKGIFASGPIFVLRRLEEIGVTDLTRSDLELASTIIFEFMYAASLGKRTRTKLNRFWDRFLRLKGAVAAVSYALTRPIRFFVTQRWRGTQGQDIGRYGAAVERLLDLMEEERRAAVPCDAYIFGHTHRAGIVRHRAAGRERPIVLANSGTWLYEPAKSNRVSEGTFLIIDAHAVTLYRQNADLAIRPLDIEPWPTD